MHKQFLLLLLLLLGLTAAFPAFSDDTGLHPKPFDAWLAEFKQDALAQGISQQTLDQAFEQTVVDETVIMLDRKQPESTLTLAQYLQKVINDTRIERGRELFNEHRDLLGHVGAEYGVQPEFIVALWGIETNFGDNMGSYQVVDALATLAYEGRRSEFFRKELINALKIIDADHITAYDMQGSWAGAMGQCQFMPSSFLEFAVDYDKDGQRDIWNSLPDVFASIANYLSSSGWDGSERWGVRVQLPNHFDSSLADIKQPRTLKELKTLGVRHAESGKTLPATDKDVFLLFAGEGDDAVPYLITGNYKVLLKWNRSRYFATAVGMLADEIGATSHAQ